MSIKAKLYFLSSLLSTQYLTLSLEQNPSWEPLSLLLHLLEKFPVFYQHKFHHRTHGSPPLDLILNYVNSVQIPTAYFVKINFNNILRFISTSLNLSYGWRCCHLIRMSWNISQLLLATISFYWKQLQDFRELHHVAGRHIGESWKGKIDFLFANFQQFARKPREKKNFRFMNVDVQ
jgi:hypothetical protein